MPCSPDIRNWTNSAAHIAKATLGQYTDKYSELPQYRHMVEDGLEHLKHGTKICAAWTETVY